MLVRQWKEVEKMPLSTDWLGIMESLTKLFQLKVFKGTVFLLGLAFIVLTFVASLNPQPFLRFGYLGVFVFNLFGPGTLLIPFVFRHMNVFVLAFVSALGMALNDSVSWLVGKSGDVVLPRSKRVENLKKNISRYGPPAFFFWALIPFPYDLVGLLAGYLEFKYKSFIIPTFLGRFTRFLILGSGLVLAFGKVI